MNMEKFLEDLHSLLTAREWISEEDIEGEYEDIEVTRMRIRVEALQKQWKALTEEDDA